MAREITEVLNAIQALGARMDARLDALAGRVDTLIDAIADVRVELAQHLHDD